MDSDKIIVAVLGVTKKWAKQRKAEERHASAASRRYDAMVTYRRRSVKSVASEVMEAAYMKASSGGTLPAHARQIMYAARGPIQEQTGKALDDQYFCQTLLPDHMSLYSRITAEWDVVFDARGHLVEPHTDKVVSLGTLDVRRYLGAAKPPSIEPLRISSPMVTTSGPEGRYQAILFIEKEGFMPLFKAVDLAEKYDIAIMSTKGMSNTASRSLVDRLCGQYNIPLLVAHDFDKAGFSIVGTLQNDTRRYEFENAINVIDIGLRLADVEEYQLAPEDVYYRMAKRKVKENLRRNGADEAEIDFLLEQRVELNAFPSQDLIEWLEAKFAEHGIEKVIPDDELLEDACRHVMEARYLEQHTDEILKMAREYSAELDIPSDLREQVEAALQDHPTIAWDQAIRNVADELAGGE